MADNQYPGVQLNDTGKPRASSGFFSASNFMNAFLGSKKQRSESTEDPEERAKAEAEAGLAADYIIMYAVSAETTAADDEEADESQVDVEVADEAASGATAKKAEKAKQCKEAIEKLAEVGLVLREQPTQDGQSVIVKITCPLDMLKDTAERLGISMRLKEDVKAAKNLKVGYERFFKEHERDYALKEHGRLFSSLERQRITSAIMEGRDEVGGAELNLDQLVAQKVFKSHFPLHIEAEVEHLFKRWITIIPWPFTVGGERRRVLPDLGFLQQPMIDVRDYFGEKIAFYFAWMENYTLWLLVLMWLAAIDAIISAAGDRDSTAVTLKPAFYTLIIVIWITVHHENWKRTQVATAYKWDTEESTYTETPRAEFLAAADSGPWRIRTEEEKRVCCNLGMKQRKGKYFGGRFLQDAHAKTEELVMDVSAQLAVYSVAVPTLLMMAVVMLVVNISIMTYRLILSISSQYEDSFGAEYQTYITGILSTVWITVMNLVYKQVAVKLTDLENHRTETSYENTLIFKTFVFQFANSYTTLFYIAFVKGTNVSPFSSFGLTDANGQPYRDACGLRNYTANYTALDCDPDGENCRYVFVTTSCMDTVAAQMQFYTILKPLYEIPLQVIIPFVTALISRKLAERRQAKADEAAEAQSEDGRSSTPVVTDPALVNFGAKIEEQAQLPKFSGTFNEYNTKVVQYGYVAMFGTAFPMATLAGFISNFLELRVDAFKLVYQTRRPVYWGAPNIGHWEEVMVVLSWIAVFVNVLLITYTDDGLRMRFLIPLLFGSEPSNACEPSFSTCGFDADYGSGVGNGTSIGVDPTWNAGSSCVEKVRNCYSQIGGEEWLPASVYLKPGSSMTEDYVTYGLCNSTGSFDAGLFDPVHCEWCNARMMEVTAAQAWFVIILEHVLLSIKVFISWVVPDTPMWVLRDKALADAAELNRPAHLTSRNRANSATHSRSGSNARTGRPSSKIHSDHV